MEAQPVYPVHPHVAPLESSYTPSLALQSPHFNLLDFVWNLGEGVTTDASGHYLGGGAGYGPGNYPIAPPAPGTFIPGVNVTPAPVPGGGWSTVTVANQSVVTYRGFLDVGQAGNAHEAAFFLAYPASWVSSPPQDPVLIVHFLPTVVPNASTSEPLAERYPYWNTASGLRNDDPLDMQTMNGHAIEYATQGFAEILIVPRTTGHPFWSEVQRGIEAVGLAKDLMVPPQVPQGFQIRAVMAVGTSVGGAFSALATAMFPNIFHASISFGAPPEPQRYLHQQELWTYVMGLSGFKERGMLPFESVLDWTQWMSHVESAWAHISYASRVYRGMVQRPSFVVFADEDITCSGSEWLAALMGSSLPLPYPPMPNYGRFDVVAGVPVFFSVKDKAGHADRRALDIYLMNDPNGARLGFAESQRPDTAGLGYSIGKPVDVAPFLASFAIASAAQTVPEPPRFIPSPGDLETRQAFDRAFFERVAANETVTADLFVDDPNDPWNAWDPMKLRSNGTQLGLYESVVIANQKIYVGSADGFVSCLQVGTGDVLETIGKSKDMGYAVHGLAYGDLGNGDVLVAATYRGIHTLDPTPDPNTGTLQTLDHAEFHAPTVENTMFVRPHHLVIAPFGAARDPHLFLTTAGGWLMCFDGNLDLVWKYHEPGIRELLASTHASSVMDRDDTRLILHSGREHLFALSLYTNQPPVDVQLNAASQTFKRRGTDVEPVNFGGDACYAVLQQFQMGGQQILGGVSGIHLYRQGDLSFRGDLASITLNPPPPELPSEFPRGGHDLAIYPDATNPSSKFIVLTDEILAVYDHGGFKLGEKSLSSLPANQTGALPVQVGEIDGDSLPEVVVTTTRGHIFWCEFADLLTPGSQLTPRGTNESLAATWGMDFNESTGTLRVITQGGRVYDIDPVTGTPTTVLDFVDSRYTSFPWAGTLYGVSAGRAEFDPSGMPFSVFGKFTVKVDTYSKENAPPLPGIPYNNFALVDHIPARYGATMSPKHGTGSNTRLFASWGNFLDPMTNTKEIVSIWKLVYDSALQRSDMTFVGDTHHRDQTPPLPPRIPLRHDLRTEDISAMEALAFGQVVQQGRYDLIVSTFGGSVILIDANPAPGLEPSSLAESDDYGCGSVALTCGDLDGDHIDEVLVGTLAAPTRATEDPQAPASAGFYGMQGYVHVLRYDAQQGHLVEVARTLVGVGVFGLKVAEIDASSTGPELIATTLEGDLMVFGADDILSSGATPLYHYRFPGSVGAYNSILVRDLVTHVPGTGGNGGEVHAGSDGVPEVYVAGSSGLRRLIVR